MHDKLYVSWSWSCLEILAGAMLSENGCRVTKVAQDIVASQHGYGNLFKEVYIPHTN